MAVQQRDGAVSAQLKRGQEEFQRVRGDVSTINADLRELTRMEVQLAKAEMREEAMLAVRGAAWAGLAITAAELGLVFAFATVMLILWVWMPMWAAALITTLLIMAVGATAASMARERFRQIKFVPDRTMRSVRKDIQCLKDQLTSSAK